MLIVIKLSIIDSTFDQLKEGYSLRTGCDTAAWPVSVVRSPVCQMVTRGPRHQLIWSVIKSSYCSTLTYLKWKYEISFLYTHKTRLVINFLLCPKIGSLTDRLLYDILTQIECVSGLNSRWSVMAWEMYGSLLFMALFDFFSKTHIK